jgi:hypothetical protein
MPHRCKRLTQIVRRRAATNVADEINVLFSKDKSLLAREMRSG